jgi:hypothetical protein
MPAELSPELLAQVASAVFEEVAFVFTEPTERPPRPDEECVRISLTFSGPRTGRLSLTAPRAFGVQVAATIAGDDVAESPEALTHGDDALRELLNIIAGRLLGEWDGTNAIYEIGIPERTVIAAADLERQDLRSRALCSATLVAEDGAPLQLAVTPED